MMTDGEFVRITSGPRAGKCGVFFGSSYLGVPGPLVAGPMRGGVPCVAKVEADQVEKASPGFRPGPIPIEERW